MNDSRVAVYSIKPVGEFLIESVLPGSRFVAASSRDNPDDVLRSIGQECRAFFFHIDLSVSANFPVERQALVRGLQRRGVVLFNAMAVDITKKTVQAANLGAALPSTVAARSGADEEKLIVKTNLNHGGKAEVSLLDLVPSLAGGWRINPDFTSPDSYVVLPRREVPSHWWVDPALIIERYITNDEGTFYRVYLAGERIVVSKITSHEVIKRPAEGLPRESTFWDATRMEAAGGESREFRVAAAVRRVCSDLAVDFAAIDVLQDPAGAHYVVDVNPTPYWGDEEQPQIINYLRQGLSF